MSLGKPEVPLWDPDLCQQMQRRQNTVELSSFGSEFVALRISTDIVKPLRYNLREFGVKLEGLAEVYGEKKVSGEKLQCTSISLGKSDARVTCASVLAVGILQYRPAQMRAV